ncbi:hypothetical protein [Halobellus litoreus]|uniref:Uncharacterized protein n=1 Tax=Halobellus litoreus TaxID=755310 RepID=A0ABD6DW43_9EURY|nr:hypothetical protein [Halobellus litoreus]
MMNQTLYPALIGASDIGIAVVLLLIAPLLGVMMAVVGALVLAMCIVQQLDQPPTTKRSRVVRDA